MTNTNALTGFECPHCGQTKEFMISTRSWSKVTDEGAVVTGDVEWGESDLMYCASVSCAAIQRSARYIVQHFLPIPDTLRAQAVVVDTEGRVRSVASSKPGRFTVSDIEDAVGGRFDVITCNDRPDVKLFRLSCGEDGYGPFNRKIHQKFGCEIRGTVMIVPSYMMRWEV